MVGDESQLRQVFDNLLGNIRTHTPPGTRAEVTVSRLGNDVVIAVADHGGGIDARQREAIFERFFRSDSSRSRASGGSGLGLAIAAAIVQQHHGRIVVVDTPGGGATFVVSLPSATPGEVSGEVPAA